MVKSGINFGETFSANPNYNDAIANPKLIATQVNEFLGGKWDEKAMITAIDPSLRHQKS